VVYGSGFAPGAQKLSIWRCVKEREFLRAGESIAAPAFNGKVSLPSFADLVRDDVSRPVDQDGHVVVDEWACLFPRDAEALFWMPAKFQFHG
jgi:hypothetical protein